MMDIPLLTSDVDEKLMRGTVAKCYGAYSRGFHVSAEHYRYLVEQIISLRQFVKRLDGEAQRCPEAADSERLDWLEREMKKSPTGISFDCIPSVEGEAGGVRFLRHHLITNPKADIRKAIDEAALETGMRNWHASQMAKPFEDRNFE